MLRVYDPDYSTEALEKLSKKELIQIVQHLGSFEREYMQLKAAKELEVKCSVFVAGMMILEWYNLRRKTGDKNPNPTIPKKRLKVLSQIKEGPFQYSFAALQKAYYRNLEEFRKKERSEALDDAARVILQRGLFPYANPPDEDGETIFKSFLNR